MAQHLDLYRMANGGYGVPKYVPPLPPPVAPSPVQEAALPLLTPPVEPPPVEPPPVVSHEQASFLNADGSTLIVTNPPSGVFPPQVLPNPELLPPPNTHNYEKGTHKLSEEKTEYAVKLNCPVCGLVYEGTSQYEPEKPHQFNSQSSVKVHLPCGHYSAEYFHWDYDYPELNA